METRKEYQASYMRKYRASHSSYKEKERKRDRDYKKMKRRTDPEWLAKERTRRRVYGKISRHRNKEKDKITREKYRLVNKHKEQARMKINRENEKGGQQRPKSCEICKLTPEWFNDKRAKSGLRYPLRADHYKGYEKKNWLIVRWICKDCDGRQLRSKKELVYDKM